MNWLRQRLDELNMSQSELTRLLQIEGMEVSSSAISHWTNGRYNPPLEDDSFRRALANALKLEIPELLRRAGYPVINGKHSDKAERAAILIDRMTPEDQDKALRVIEALSS